jgi:hypothetical protein
MKKNCWEVMGCGRKRRGHNDSCLKCPVPEMTSANGINNGKNGGRICWLIANTMCKDEDESTFESMIRTCGECDFYKRVKAEGVKTVTLSIEMLREAYEKIKRENSMRASAKQSKNRIGPEP